MRRGVYWNHTKRRTGNHAGTQRATESASQSALIESAANTDLLDSESAGLSSHVPAKRHSPDPNDTTENWESAGPSHATHSPAKRLSPDPDNDTADSEEDPPDITHYAEDDYDGYLPEHNFARDVEHNQAIPVHWDISAAELELELESTQAQVNSRPGTGNQLDQDANTFEEVPLEALNNVRLVEDPKATACPANDAFTVGEHDKFLVRLGLWADFCQLPVKEYSMLVEVLKTATLSNLQALPKSLATLQKYRRHLPLTKIYGSKVQLDRSQIPQRVSDIGEVFFFDLQESFEKTILCNASLMSAMYFGPAKLVTNRSEVYHGTLWAESIRTTSGVLPRYPGNEEAIFPSDCVQFDHNGRSAYGQVRYIWSDCRESDHIEPNWLLQLHPIVSFNDLSSNDQRLLGFSTEELLLLEDNSALIDLPPSSLHGKADFVLGLARENVNNPNQCVSRILSAESPRIRTINERHSILAENELRVFGRSTLQADYVRRNNKTILSIPTLLFVDGFGLYQNNYRSLLGCYFSPANLPCRDRDKQRNHFVLTLGPFAADLKDVVSVIGPSLQKMDSGVGLYLNGEMVYVVSTPIAITGDMPQQNKNCGALSPQKANVFCRFCFIDREAKSMIDKAHLRNARYSSKESRIRHECLSLTNATALKKLNSWGMAPEPSIWRAKAFPAFEPVLQTPIDFNHSDVKGMGTRYQDIFFDMLSAQGSREINEATRTFPMPHGWVRLQNPTTHRGSYSFTEVGRFAMILPYIIRLHMSTASVKKKQYNNFLRVFGLSREQFMTVFTRLFVDVAQNMVDGLQSEVTRSVHSRIQVNTVKIRSEYHKMVQIFTSKDDKNKVANLQKRPNQHIGIHLAENLLQLSSQVEKAV